MEINFTWLQLGIGYLIIINFLAIGLFWFDKWMARANSWRVPELILWLSAAFGGSIGALLAMNWFHHKTKKLSFQLVFVIILVIQIAAIVLYYQYIYQ